MMVRIHPSPQMIVFSFIVDEFLVIGKIDFYPKLFVKIA